ncbi:MAG: ABC transporter ATP-binding protein [Lachnospiraceae bacterium]|nr:ABC transporter ATP-binding protein [Lachnospiraceae bacterium]
MKKLHTYIGKHWLGYMFAILCMIAAIVLDMIYPMITESIIDDVMLGGKTELLFGLLVGIVIVGVGRAITGYFKEFTFDKLASGIGSEIRKDLFNHIQSLSMNFFAKTNTGELMARVKDDVDRVWDVLGFVGMLLIEVAIHVSIVLYCMFIRNWKLALLPLATMIISGVAAVVMERKLDKVYEGISEENAVLTTVAQENLAGVRTVKAFAREKFEIEKFLSHNNRYYELNITQSKVMAKYYPIFQFVGKALPVITTVLGGISVMKGEMSLGALVAFVEYTRNCTWPMEMMGWLTNGLSSGIASYKKIKKIYGENAEICNKEETVTLDKVEGSVTFENVSFAVEGKEILQDISFHLPAGKTLGIMGATGSGKSSIINLLQRFFDVCSGSVRVDGVDIRDLTLKQLRSSIAVVLQDVFLFSDTIEENIKMGQRKLLSEEEIKYAANRARASQFIEKLDEQYETVIGERGVGLSGGQKQRISIARAFSKNSPILVLDDSTSALDMETEVEIQKNLNSLKGITKIIIAHRISAVRHADEIIYLEDGKIAERGTHEELLQKKGLYYRTYQAQYGGDVYGS